MQDQPTAQQLVEAVAQFLNTEIAPTIHDPRLRFRTLVAVNVLNVVTRELQMGDAQLHAEYTRLRELSLSSFSPLPPSTMLRMGEGPGVRDIRAQVDALTRDLAARIRAGEADEGAFHDAVFAHVEQTVIEKLEIANPRDLAKQRSRA